MSETSWGRRKYRTTSWKAYNAALKARGDLTIWLDKSRGEEVMAGTFERQVAELNIRASILN